uniref:Uncharacterized protein n=1 Tax=Meloidogyne enterolobii TaxID=390850 RepID=A0A6V7X3X3_MELEN|nr:unnamed protein product [Meloidogyne enterolobii]
MAELDDDYDDRKLRNERKLAEYYQIRKDSEIKQAETDELHNIIEEEMSELDEIQRKIDAKTKKPTFWGNFWKAAKEVKEKIIETTSEYLDFSGNDYDEDSESTENVKKQENETTSEPESEIINVTERLSNIGNDNLKHREELFSSASTSSKTNPSAQDENDEQQLFDSKMQELDQITRNNNIRKAVVEEDFNFIRKQRSEYFERFKKLDAKTKKPTFWGNFWKAAKEVKEKIIETTSEYLDFSGNDYDEDSESTENVKKQENETTSEPESEIINVTERLSNIGNDNLKHREELFSSASTSSKTNPSAQDENDEQQLFDSKMQELDQITRNNNIRKAVVEEDFNFIRKQRSEYFERFKKLDAKTKKPTFWGNFWKAAKRRNDYDEDSESTENVEKKENETTSEPESEIINVTERLSNIGNDNLKQREELFNSASKSSKTDPSAQNAGSGVYVENRKNDTTNQPESEIGNVTEKLNKTENDSVKHQEKLLHKTTTIENEIFYKQGTSKQNDVEVNNSQHKENVPIIDQGIPGTVGNILINQNFTGLNLKDKLDKADELLKSARSADKKIEKEEEHIKQNQEILNNIGANIEKMEQEKNKPGLLNKFIDGAKTLTNYGIDTAKHIFDIGYKWATKTFSRATFSMGIKQRTRHRMPKEEGDPNGPSNAEPKPSNAKPKPDEKTKSNDIPKNTAQTRNKKDDDGDNSDNSKKDDDGSGGGSPPSNNSPNNSNSFAKAVIAGAAVGAVVGGVVGGLSGALVGGAVGAATVAIVYACDAVVKTCNNVNNVINNVKNEASSCYESVKEIVKSAWNWFKGLFS